MGFYRTNRVLWQYEQDYGVTEVTIPHRITKISASAFYSCIDLKRVIIPDSVDTIGEQAFCGCENLVNIIIPNSVTELKTATFSYCKNLEHVNLSSNIMRIYSNCFYKCEHLKRITLPESLQQIAEEAFDEKFIENIDVFSYRVFSLLKGKLKLITLASVIKNYYRGRIEYNETDMHKFNVSINKNKYDLIKKALKDEELLEIMLYDMKDFISYKDAILLIDKNSDTYVNGILLEYINTMFNTSYGNELNHLNLDDDKDSGISFIKQ